MSHFNMHDGIIDNVDQQTQTVEKITKAYAYSEYKISITCPVRSSNTLINLPTTMSLWITDKAQVASILPPNLVSHITTPSDKRTQRNLWLCEPIRQKLSVLQKRKYNVIMMWWKQAKEVILIWDLFLTTLIWIFKTLKAGWIPVGWLVFTTAWYMGIVHSHFLDTYHQENDCTIVTVDLKRRQHDQWMMIGEPWKILWGQPMAGYWEFFFILGGNGLRLLNGTNV